MQRGEGITEGQHMEWHLLNDWWEFMPKSVVEVINMCLI